jgi:hypothetical protein
VLRDSAVLPDNGRFLDMLALYDGAPDRHTGELDRYAPHAPRSPPLG